MKPLEGQVALVTGASRGVGAATAVALAAAGGTVQAAWRDRRNSATNRHDIYAATPRGLAFHTRLRDVTRHMLGLYQGTRGARAYRRIMSDDARKPGAGLETVRRARAAIEEPSQAA